MKLFISILAFIIIDIQATIAQSDANYAHYMFNSLPFNPAYAGNKDNPTLISSYRMQWIGIEGAPQTFFLSTDLPLRSNKMAIAADVYADKIGDFSVLKSYLSYAYKIQLNSNYRASFGLAMGYENRNNNRPNNSSSVDPIFNNLNFNEHAFDARTGIYISSDRFYFGLSATSLLSQSIEASNSITNYSTFYLSSGYTKSISPTLTLFPSFLYKDNFMTGGVFNFTQYIGINSKYWFGFSYRNGINTFNNKNLKFINSNSRVLSMLMNIEILENMRIGYAYDYSLSTLNQFENGSHELLITYTFKTKRINRILNPRYL